MSQYIRTSSGAIALVVASVANLPPSASDGVLAVTRDTATEYYFDAPTASWIVLTGGGGGGSGTVTSVSVVTANGVSGSVANATTTPAITLTLGAISPSSVAASGTVTGSNLSGTNTGDVTLGTANGLSLVGQALSLQLADATHTGALSSTDWSTFNNKQASGSYITALTGDVTASGPGSSAATIANSAVTNAKMADMPDQTIKGNVSGGASAPSDLTAAEVNAMLGTTNAVTSIGTLNSETKSADGAVIDTNALVLQTADASAPGLMVSADYNKLNAGNALTFSGYDAAGSLTSVPGWAYDETTTLSQSRIAVTLPNTITDIYGLTVQTNVDDANANVYRGVNVNSVIGATTATAINGVSSFQSAMTFDANATTTNISVFEDGNNHQVGSAATFYATIAAHPTFDLASLDQYRGLINTANFGNTSATAINSAVDVLLVPTFGANASVVGYTAIDAGSDHRAGSSITNYGGVNIHPTIDSNTVGSVNTFNSGVQVGQGAAASVNSHIDISLSPKYYSGANVNGYTGLNIGPQFAAGSTATSLFGINLSVQDDVTSLNSMTGINSNNNIGANATSTITNYSDMFLGANVNADATITNYKGLTIQPNFNASAGPVTNFTGINVSPSGTINCDNAKGIEIDMQNVVGSTTPPTALSTGGGINAINYIWDTSQYTPPATFFVNQFGGGLRIAAGSPISGGQFGFGNGLGGFGVEFNDDMGADFTGARIGWSINGFATQVAGAAGKTFDTLNFMMAGASVPPSSTGGTVTDVSFFRSVGLLPSGGSLNVTNMYGFKADPLMDASGATNLWGVYVGASTADNFFKKNVVIGGTTGQPSGSYALDVTGVVKIADGSEGAGKVLTSDASGVATWSTAGTGSNPYYVANFTLSGTDITNQFVTLPGTPTTASETVMQVVGGIAQDYGVDYSISGTTLTFLGDLAIGGPAALVAGDKLIVQFD